MPLLVNDPLFEKRIAVDEVLDLRGELAIVHTFNVLLCTSNVKLIARVFV